MEKTQLNNAPMGSPAAALRPSSSTAAEDDDTASLFDLELRPANTDECNDGKDIIDITTSCGGDGALISDLILSSSPSDGLFFKGRLRPLDPSTAPTSKSSGGKLRILMLGLKNPQPAAAAATELPSPERKRQNRFVLKEVPLVSLFTRDGGTGRRAKVHAGDGGGGSPPPAEKRPSDALQRYLSKIKPFYVKVSKRYSEKIRLSNPMSSPVDAAARSKSFPVPSAGGLKMVTRRLGKSRSASAAVTSVRSPPATAAVPVRRRDDSLLEQQDGIQSAIAHCKRSLERSP